MISPLRTGLSATLITCILATIGCSVPSDNTVKKEFLDRYSDSKIHELELIFEQDGRVVYLVTAETKELSERAKYDFALKRSYGIWKWCDDQTADRQCK